MSTLSDTDSKRNPSRNGHSHLGNHKRPRAVARALAKQRAAAQADAVIRRASTVAERKPNARLIEYFVKENYEQHADVLLAGVVAKWNRDGIDDEDEDDGSGVPRLGHWHKSVVPALGPRGAMKLDKDKHLFYLVSNMKEEADREATRLTLPQVYMVQAGMIPRRQRDGSVKVMMRVPNADRKTDEQPLSSVGVLMWTFRYLQRHAKLEAREPTASFRKPNKDLITNLFVTEQELAMLKDGVKIGVPKRWEKAVELLAWLEYRQRLQRNREPVSFMAAFALYWMGWPIPDDDAEFIKVVKEIADLRFDLVKAGLIHFVGKGRNTRYLIPPLGKKEQGVDADYLMHLFDKA